MKFVNFFFYLQFISVVRMRVVLARLSYTLPQLHVACIQYQYR